MSTLVTGATGLVGNNVVRLLRQRGEEVRALVRENSDSRPLDALEVDVYHGDVRDPQAVSDAARGVDLIIHAAAIVKLGRTGLEQFRSVNVEGTRNVATAARRTSTRMVHVSSTDTIGIISLDQPADEETPFEVNIHAPYVITKLEAEQVILEEVNAGLDAVIANPSFMLGPWDWKPSSGQMLLEVAHGRGWLAPHGYFSVADARDVAEGILSAAKCGKVAHRYILAGQTMSYLESWRLFADVVGVRSPWGHAAPTASKIAGRLGDLWGLITGKEPSLNSGAVAVADFPRNYSSARAQAKLGYRNRSLRQTVEDSWAWFQEFGYTRTRGAG